MRKEVVGRTFIFFIAAVVSLYLLPTAWAAFSVTITSPADEERVDADPITIEFDIDCGDYDMACGCDYYVDVDGMSECDSQMEMSGPYTCDISPAEGAHEYYVGIFGRDPMCAIVDSATSATQTVHANLNNPTIDDYSPAEDTYAISPTISFNFTEYYPDWDNEQGGVYIDITGDSSDTYYFSDGECSDLGGGQYECSHDFGLSDGDYEYSITVYDEGGFSESQGASSFSIAASPGTISILINTTTTSLDQGKNFPLTVNASCTGGPCYGVVLWVDPEAETDTEYWVYVLLTLPLLISAFLARKTGQTATEYLIILAVVVIIALIVVVTLGGIPGIGGSIDKQANDAKLQSLDVGVTSYAIGPTSIDLTVRNNLPHPIRVNSITVDNTTLSSTDLPVRLAIGEQQVISSSSITSFTRTEDQAGTRYELEFQIAYEDGETGTSYTLGNNEKLYLVDDYADSGAYAHKGVLTADVGATPFYLEDMESFVCDDPIPAGSSCQHTFTINATGESGSYIFYAFNSTIESNRITVAIN